MSRRRRIHRKRFDCGHRGYGQYCHCCADRLRQRQLKQAKYQQRQQKRQQWQALFAEDPINLRKLPKRIVTKTREVLSALNTGIGYWQLSGKRLNSVRNAIRIPITYRYRLICRDDGDGLIPLEVLSHEDYNPIAANPKRQLARWFSRGSADR